MASPFLAAAAGFGTGLASGVTTGFEMQQKRALMQLEQQRAGLETISAMGQAMKIADPAFRTLAVKKLMPAVGMDPNTQDGKDFLTAVNKGAQDTLNWMSDSLHQAGMNMPPGAVGQAWQNDPAGFLNMMFQMRRLGLAQQIATGDTTQPGANDNTGAAPSAGAPAPSGVSQNGTPSATPSPSAAPIAAPQGQSPAGGVAQSPAPTPGKTQPIQSVPAGTGAGVPARDNPQMFWDVTKDPYVQRLTQKITALRGLGDAGTGFADTLQKQVDQYIANKNENISNWFKNQELAISRGQLSVSQFHARLDAARFQWEQFGAPMSDVGKIVHDANNGLLVTAPPAAGAASTVGAGATAQGGGTAPAAGATPASMLPQVDTAPAGSIPITDTAILKHLGVEQGMRAVIDPNGKTLIVRPTTSSTEGTAEQSVAQIALDSSKRGQDTVNTLYQDYIQHPEDFGSAAWLKGNIQNVGALVKDYTQIIPGFRNTLTGADKAAFDKYYNPKLPKIEQLEQLLTLSVASEMWRGTGGSMGGFAEVLKSAEDMTQLTGPGISSNEVKAHLETLKEFFDTAVQTHAGQRGQAATSNVPTTNMLQQPNAPSQAPQYKEGDVLGSNKDPSIGYKLINGQWVTGKLVNGQWQAK